MKYVYLVWQVTRYTNKSNRNLILAFTNEDAANRYVADEEDELTIASNVHYEIEKYRLHEEY